MEEKRKTILRGLEVWGRGGRSEMREGGGGEGEVGKGNPGYLSTINPTLQAHEALKCSIFPAVSVCF